MIATELGWQEAQYMGTLTLWASAELGIEGNSFIFLNMFLMLIL